MLFCMGDSGQSSEDKKADRNSVSKVQAGEVSRGKDCIGCWTLHNVYYGLAKSLSAFCSCPVTLPETKIKGSRLIKPAEKSSRQLNV